MREREKETEEISTETRHQISLYGTLAGLQFVVLSYLPSEYWDFR